MRFVVVAALAGLALGVLRGGRLSRVGDTLPFRLWPALAAGVALQVVTGFDGVPGAFGLLLVSYAVLLAFCTANVRGLGMALVGCGITLNAIVIAANHGMPVDRSAARRAGFSAEVVQSFEPTVKRHIEDGDDSLMVLADVVPVPLLREVLSVGDLVLATGMALVIASLTRGAGVPDRG